MAPPRGTKRKSDESSSVDAHAEKAHNMTDHTGATRTGSFSAAQEGPRKKQKTGITMSQKQALIDNLQLEITDRARKLRAQYNLQAQGLRTRIEIRVNRIPLALRKAKMGEIADKYRNGQHPQLPKSTPSALSSSLSRPPPVPEKDAPVARSTSQVTSHTATSSRSGPGRPPKQTSNLTLSTNKENLDNPTESEKPEKKQRSHPVLSPSSPNVRPLPRTTPGGKPLVSRPGASTTAGQTSPMKQNSASNLFSNLAEKARSTRTGATARKQTASASTTASSASGSARGKNAAGATGTGSTKGAATTKPVRRFSDVSESSEGSTSAPVKKGPMKGTTAASDNEGVAPLPAKRTVIGTIRKGVTGAGATKKGTVPKKAAQASTATGRVLRKRG